MATPSSSPKILLSGDACGRLHSLFKRVSSLNKSTGPFDALLCVGQFFSEQNKDGEDVPDEISEYLGGRASVPVSTYFIGDFGSSRATSLLSTFLPGQLGFAVPSGAIQLCPNLFWLPSSGIFPLHGLRVAYLSGRRQLRNGNQARQIGFYNEDDVGALRALSDGPEIIDILLTNEWPSGVVNGSNTSEYPPQVLDHSGCDPVVADLVAELKPRYHIAGGKSVFYAREPYVNESAAQVTRFIGLAMVANKEKQKFIHAISPIPASSMSAAELISRPPNTTPSPYRDLGKMNSVGDTNKRLSVEDHAQYWRYDYPLKKHKTGADTKKLCFKFTSSGSCPRGNKCNFRHDENSREHYIRNVCFDFLNKGECEKGAACKFNHSLSKDGNVSSSQRKSSGSCWFCLSNPDVESHLVLSIGESYYCALAKGPLVDNHVLLVPIEHCSNTLLMHPETEAELGRYKNALTKYFWKQEKVAIYFEWVSQQSCHANLQVVPISLSKAPDVEKIFKLAAKRLGFEFDVVDSDSEGSKGRTLLRFQHDGKANMFYVELPEGRILLHCADAKEKFPVQFGREVLAGLLSTPDRADWRNCKVTKEKETQMVESFKHGLKEFYPAR